MRAGLVQPGQERRRAAGPAGAATSRWPAATSLGPLGQVLGAEQLAPDGPGEELLAGVGAAGAETLEGSGGG